MAKGNPFLKGGQGGVTQKLDDYQRTDQVQVNTETEQVTDDAAREAAAVASREKRAVRKENTIIVCDHIMQLYADVKIGTREYKVLMAAQALKPGFHATPTLRGINSRIHDFFSEKETGSAVSEMDIFVALKAGRSEMRNGQRFMIQKVEPAARVWVWFDPVKENWIIVAKGPDAPENWKGVRPVTTAEVTNS